MMEKAYKINGMDFSAAQLMFMLPQEKFIINKRLPRKKKKQLKKLDNGTA